MNALEEMTVATRIIRWLVFAIGTPVGIIGVIAIEENPLPQFIALIVAALGLFSGLSLLLEWPIT